MTASPALTPVVVFGADQRASVEDFARAHNLDAAALKRRYAAAGIIRCGNAHGSGQLTVADDVVTTAAHVLYDRAGHLRGDSAIAVSRSIPTAKSCRSRCRSTAPSPARPNPYAESAVHDWAVVKLARPLPRRRPIRSPRRPARSRSASSPAARSTGAAARTCRCRTATCATARKRRGRHARVLVRLLRQRRRLGLRPARRRRLRASRRVRRLPLGRAGPGAAVLADALQLRGDGGRRVPPRGRAPGGARATAQAKLPAAGN